MTRKTQIVALTVALALAGVGAVAVAQPQPSRGDDRQVELSGHELNVEQLKQGRIGPVGGIGAARLGIDGVVWAWFSPPQQFSRSRRLNAEEGFA